MRKYFPLILLGMSIPVFATSTLSSSIQQKKKVVAIMYVTECEECNFDKKEGEWSFVSQKGSEYCPVCNDWDTLYNIDTSYITEVNGDG